MARIPDEELTRIKDEISLLRLVEAKGIKLEKKGADYKINGVGVDLSAVTCCHNKKNNWGRS